MFCVVLLTFIIGIIAVVVRVNSVRSGEVKIKYYRTMQGQEVPEFITRTTRSVNNMFEIPVLFYVVSTLFISVGMVGPVPQALAWSFVVLRVCHTAVHLTYNNVLHRSLLFWAGFIVVFAMWVVLVVGLA